MERARMVRHASKSLLLGPRITPKIISAMLRHASIAITVVRFTLMSWCLPVSHR
jgi:hypothetical protein